MVQGTMTEEVTGIWKGTLLEDMIQTVQRVKKPYIDVLIPELFEEEFPHPLTFVPVWYQSLPLLKGDEVYIQYNQDSLHYPVLYKPVKEFDKVMTDKQTPLPAGTQFPSAAGTEYVFTLGNGFYLIGTKSYATLIKGKQAIILAESGIYMKAPDVRIDATNNVIINGHLKVLP